MKPNWSDAPEWANYLAQDANGGWYWYEKQPVILEFDPGWTRGFQGGRVEQANCVEDWADTIEERQK